MPNLWKRAGVIFRIMVSEACTRPAMMPIKTTILRKVRLKGTHTYLNAAQLSAALIIITKVKVILIPTAVSIFLETPKKMQRPRKRVKTKLLISEALTTNSKSFIAS